MIRIIIKYHLAFFISGLLLITIPFSISAQKIPLYFESYTTENGLPQNLIGKIAQDKSGFIWVTTRDGLSRFDGYHFVNFKHEISDTNSLAADFLTDLVIDDNNGLWISTFGKGLCYYNQELNQFYRLNDKKDSSSQNLSEILSLYIDQSNYLWIGTVQGLCRSKMVIDELLYDDRLFQDKFIDCRSSKTNEKMQCIYEDSEQNIWTGSQNGMFLVNKKNNQYEQVLFSNKNVSVNSICEFGKDYLLIASDLGLYKYHKKHKTAVNILKSKPFELFSENLKIDRILPDKNGSFWIGTYNEGLLFYDTLTESVIQYVNEPNDKHSIPGNMVSSLYIDKNNTLFTGVRSKGLNITKIRNNYFQRFRHDPNNNSISTNIIWDIHVETDNEIWIGTHDGLNLFNPVNREFKIFKTKSNDRTGASTFLVIDKLNNETFFLSSLGNGLMSFNKKTKSLNSVNWAATQNIDINYITAINQKSDSSFWISYWGKGIIEYKISGKVARKLTDETNKYIRSVFQDSQGRFWFCTWGNGLLLFDKSQNQFKRFTQQDGISTDYLYSIHEDADGYLWLGSSSGLTKFDPETLSPEGKNHPDRLNKQEVYSILEDDHENLWLGTNNGLYKYNKNNGSFINYNVKDGLQSNEFNQFSYAKTPDGHMLFGGINGFNYFHPDSITESTYTPNLVITAFSLFYKNFKRGDLYNDRNILDKTIEYTDTLLLNNGENVIELNFSALDYFVSSEIKYSYRLIGFEDKWVNTDAQKRFASYTNLIPGKYIFQLKSTNSDGVWNDKIKQLHIIIRPAFWQSSWFRILFFIFMVIGIYVFIKIRIKRALIQQEKLKEQIKNKTKSISLKNKELKEQTEELNHLTDLLKDSNKSLEQKVRKRTKALKKALDGSKEAEKLISSFLSNLSHEIRTPMNAISGFSQLISDTSISEEERTKYGDIIINNVDSLLTLIDNIMSVSKLHTGQYDLKISSFSLKHLFNGLYVTFENSYGHLKKDVDFELLIPVENEIINLVSDVNLFKQMVFQLVDNALKYTEKGKVSFGYSVSASKSDLDLPSRLKTIATEKKNVRAVQTHFLSIFINDTGLGIAQDQQKHIFDAFTKIEGKEKLFRGTGLGLAIVKNLAEKVNAKITISSELNKGTRVLVKIPLSNS